MGLWNVIKGMFSLQHMTHIISNFTRHRCVLYCVCNVLHMCACLSSAYAVSRMSCPPCCYCGVVGLPDTTPKDHFLSVKHLSPVAFSLSHWHAHTPCASLNTIEPSPAPPCHPSKNKPSSCPTLYDYIVNNSVAALWSVINSTALLLWGITAKSLSGSNTMDGFSGDVTPIVNHN